MFTFLVVITIIVLVLLVTVTAMRPLHEEFQADLLSIQRIVGALLLIAAFALLVVTFGWGWGISLSVLTVLFYGALTRIPLVEARAATLYQKLEPSLVRFVGKFPRLFAALRVVPKSAAQHQLTSRQELERMVRESDGLLTADEKRIITQSLQFSETKVGSVMTPQSVMKTVNHDEFLGPLVLDELHALGHSRLPVIKEDIDHVVGILHTRDLLSLDIKKSTSVEKAMDRKVFYIHENDDLQHALAAFLRTRRHLFIVVNEYRETVGLVTLEDVMEALLGRKIVDEDDNHDDLRAVAARNPNRNNRPAGHVDV